MADIDRVRLGATFDEAAERYDRARPAYPPELLDALAELAGIGPDCRVLEIGCGTGQATVPLAERGCQIVAVEPGDNLARVARRNLARFPDVQVEVAAFEDWPLPPEPFDVVVAAASFHWLDPQVRTAKVADALRSGGALAIVSTVYAADGHQAFLDQLQACYQQWAPAMPAGLRLPTAVHIPTYDEELDRAGCFGSVLVGRHQWEVCYSTAAYLEVLATNSGHLALPPQVRAGLFGCLAELIDRCYGGRVTKRYLTELLVTQRR